MQTMGDEIGSCSRPKFVVNHDNNGALDLTSVTDDKIGRNLFTIEEYRPICIRLDWKSYIMQITMNILVYNEVDNNTLALVCNKCS